MGSYFTDKSTGIISYVTDPQEAQRLAANPNMTAPSLSDLYRAGVLDEEGRMISDASKPFTAVNTDVAARNIPTTPEGNIDIGASQQKFGQHTQKVLESAVAPEHKAKVGQIFQPNGQYIWNPETEEIRLLKDPIEVANLFKQGWTSPSADKLKQWGILSKEGKSSFEIAQSSEFTWKPSAEQAEVGKYTDIPQALASGVSLDTIKKAGIDLDQNFLDQWNKLTPEDKAIIRNQGIEGFNKIQEAADEKRTTAISRIEKVPGVKAGDEYDLRKMIENKVSDDDIVAVFGQEGLAKVNQLRSDIKDQQRAQAEIDAAGGLMAAVQSGIHVSTFITAGYDPADYKDAERFVEENVQDSKTGEWYSKDWQIDYVNRGLLPDQEVAENLFKSGGMAKVDRYIQTMETAKSTFLKKFKAEDGGYDLNGLVEYLAKAGEKSEVTANSLVKNYGFDKKDVDFAIKYVAATPEGKFDILKGQGRIPEGAKYAGVDSEGNPTYIPPVKAPVSIDDWKQALLSEDTSSQKRFINKIGSNLSRDFPYIVDIRHELGIKKRDLQGKTFDELSPKVQAFIIGEYQTAVTKQGGIHGESLMRDPAAKMIVGTIQTLRADPETIIPGVSSYRSVRDRGFLSGYTVTTVVFDAAIAFPVVKVLGEGAIKVVLPATKEMVQGFANPEVWKAIVSASERGGVRLSSNEKASSLALKLQPKPSEMPQWAKAPSKGRAAIIPITRKQADLLMKEGISEADIIRIAEEADGDVLAFWDKIDALRRLLVREGALVQKGTTTLDKLIAEEQEASLVESKKNLDKILSVTKSSKEKPVTSPTRTAPMVKTHWPFPSELANLKKAGLTAEEIEAAFDASATETKFWKILKGLQKEREIAAKAKTATEVERAVLVKELLALDTVSAIKLANEIAQKTALKAKVQTQLQTKTLAATALEQKLQAQTKTITKTLTETKTEVQTQLKTAVAVKTATATATSVKPAVAIKTATATMTDTRTAVAVKPATATATSVKPAVAIKTATATMTDTPTLRPPVLKPVLPNIPPKNPPTEEREPTPKPKRILLPQMNTEIESVSGAPDRPGQVLWDQGIVWLEATPPSPDNIKKGKRGEVRILIEAPEDAKIKNGTPQETLFARGKPPKEMVVRIGATRAKVINGKHISFSQLTGGGKILVRGRRGTITRQERQTMRR